MIEIRPTELRHQRPDRLPLRWGKNVGPVLLEITPRCRQPLTKRCLSVIHLVDLGWRTQDAYIGQNIAQPNMRGFQPVERFFPVRRFLQIEATFFGIPIMKVNEWYLDGHGRLELPFGVTEGPHTDQGANLGLWAEAANLPALWLTDPRVHWEAVDDDTALLYVPFGDGEQQFVVRFDPDTGRLRLLEAMRYRDETSDKILWLAGTLPGATIQAAGATLDATGAATWIDQGSPWAVFTAEEIVYNVDVQDYIQARGP